MDMKKRMKDALILCLITVIAGIGLGAIYSITKEPIAQANYEKTQDSYKEVIPDASEFTDLESFDADAADSAIAEGGWDEDNTIEGVVQAVDSSGTLLGYVITVTTHAGYGGDITFSLGYLLDGTVTGYSITTINETAGLGMKAKEEAFYSQFQDKQVEEFTVTKTGAADETEIDAISGATITSSAVTNGVNAGICYAEYLIEQTGGVLE